MAEAKPNPRVFFDITLNSIPVGRIEMELFADKVPITAENFRALCTGEKGTAESGKRLHYKGSMIHDVRPGFVWQGGEYIYGDANGTLGECNRLQEENFIVKHDRPGILTTTYGGTEGNGSEFTIVMKEVDYLDEQLVAFGIVTKGWDVISRVERVVGAVEATGGEVPSIIIADCGQISQEAALPLVDNKRKLETCSSDVSIPSTRKRLRVDHAAAELIKRMLGELNAARMKIAELEASKALPEEAKALPEQATAHNDENKNNEQGEGV